MRLEYCEQKDGSTTTGRVPTVINGPKAHNEGYMSVPSVECVTEQRSAYVWDADPTATPEHLKMHTPVVDGGPVLVVELTDRSTGRPEPDVVYSVISDERVPQEVVPEDEVFLATMVATVTTDEEVHRMDVPKVYKSNGDLRIVKSADRYAKASEKDLLLANVSSMGLCPIYKVIKEDKVVCDFEHQRDMWKSFNLQNSTDQKPCQISSNAKVPVMENKRCKVLSQKTSVFWEIKLQYEMSAQYGGGFNMILYEHWRSKWKKYSLSSDLKSAMITLESRLFHMYLAID